MDAARIVIAALATIGLVAAAQWVERVRRPPPGWTCWRIERATAAGSDYTTRCEPADGWHVEEWSGVGRVAVPDDARVVQRYPVRD